MSGNTYKSETVLINSYMVTNFNLCQFNLNSTDPTSFACLSLSIQQISNIANLITTPSSIFTLNLDNGNIFILKKFCYVFYCKRVFWIKVEQI